MAVYQLHSLAQSGRCRHQTLCLQQSVDACLALAVGCLRAQLKDTVQLRCTACCTAEGCSSWLCAVCADTAAWLTVVLCRAVQAAKPPPTPAGYALRATGLVAVTLNPGEGPSPLGSSQPASPRQQEPAFCSPFPCVVAATPSHVSVRGLTPLAPAKQRCNKSSSGRPGTLMSGHAHILLLPAAATLRMQQALRFWLHQP